MFSRRDLLRTTGGLIAASATTPIPAALLPQPAIPTPGPASEQARWLALAESLTPTLREELQSPLNLVQPVADPSLFLRWRMDTVAPASDLPNRTFHAGSSFILDFGEHRTGFLSFRVSGVGPNIDSPLRLRLIFGEVPGDVAEPFHPYKSILGEGWLPEEVITIDFLPETVRMPRRYAFRYVKIEVVGASTNCAARFEEVHAHAISSATLTPPPLPANTPANFAQIDRVALSTLRDCMQTTFEDGPRRDRRLWLGDLRLQALANYKTFRNFALVKRCLYLFAAFPREDGLLHSCVFEKPAPRVAENDFILDYAALFVPTLLDYVVHSGDKACGRDLYPTAKRQLQLVSANLNADHLFVDPNNIWIFIDWEKKLDRIAPMHALLLYCYRRGAELADLLGHHEDAISFRQKADLMQAAAERTFFDPAQGLYVSGPSKQVSLASQAWLILAGVPNKTAGAKALRAALAHPEVVMPTTPYLYHHVVAAMLACDMQTEALALIDKYWGGMVRAGADTFWEVYDPNDSLSSPYGTVHVLSFCHAWGCTPAYLLRSLSNPVNS